MSSLLAVSPINLTNNNNNKNSNQSSIDGSSNNSSDNSSDRSIDSSIGGSNGSQNVIKNLKLINSKVNGHQESSNDCLSCDEMLNKCSNSNTSDSNNGLNMQNNHIVSNNIVIDSQKNNPLQIDVSNSANNLEEDYSQPSTLSSSPVTSPVDESIRRIDEALLEEKFSKLGFNQLNRYDSPIIQINGNDSFDEEEDDSLSRAPLLRSTSLKTGKTPPGTPHRKKIVRFADALGLDLESVRHIITDDLPTVPQSAFGALKLNDRTEQSTTPANSIPWFMQKQHKSISQSRPNLQVEFIQPSSLLNFLDRVRTNKVCLENCIVSNSAGNLSITCVIRVLNISFEKSVTLRYTTNEWLTWSEALASYIPNSCDGFSDKFTVTFSVSAGGYYLSPGQRLLFALRYTANTEEYWDNNMGLNYSLIYRV